MLKFFKYFLKLENINTKDSVLLVFSKTLAE